MVIAMLIKVTNFAFNFVRIKNNKTVKIFFYR